MIVTSCFITFETTEIQSLISFCPFCSHKHLKAMFQVFSDTLSEYYISMVFKIKKELVPDILNSFLYVNSYTFLLNESSTKIATTKFKEPLSTSGPRKCIIIDVVVGLKCSFSSFCRMPCIFSRGVVINDAYYFSTKEKVIE